MKVEALINFFDIESGKQRIKGDKWECDSKRGNFLKKHNKVKSVTPEKKEGKPKGKAEGKSPVK